MKSASIFQFPEVRVVEASAGSGKTFALAKRYVQLVLGVSPAGLGSQCLEAAASREPSIRSILAITFMKKASFEMKQRILSFLKKIALKTMPEDELEEILALIGLSPDAASARAFAVMDELIRHYNFFQVQTIDSFINALLSGCAFKIGLSAKFRIKHNPFDYLAYSLDRVIERAVRDPKTGDIFTRFLDQYILLEGAGSWFPKKDILGLLSALYHQRNSYGMEFAGYHAEHDIVAQMTSIVELMRRLKENLPEKTHAGFRRFLENFCDRYKTAFDFDKLSDFFQRECFPMTGGQEAPDDIAGLWDDIRRRISALAETEAYALFSPYVDVFGETLKEFHQRAVKEDVLFMEELNRKARLLFDEGGVTVEELYYRLAARFRHYMIDEFQDTSRLQWKNLAMMVEEALSTGGSLFYVGDKKQAIYGFRGGEAALFDELKQEFAHFNVAVERLAKNYRSREAVVNFNNMVFDFENLDRFIRAREEMESEKKTKKTAVVFSELDRQRLAGTFGNCAQMFRDDRRGGYVRVEHIDGSKRRDRDEMTRVKTAVLVKELHGRFAWKDIAVLTRKNSEVEQVTGWLMEEGIPVRSERTLNITENTVIQELIAFLTFLNSPIDHLAFARVILGDVFCRASGLSKEQMQQFLFDLRQRKDRVRESALYREFRQSYPAVWDEYIAPFFRSVGFYPVYELVVSILQKWKVLDCFEDQCGFVMQMLEVIKKCEQDGCDLISFLEYVDSLRNEDAFVNVAELDSVQILTTHKAKGLEFKAVILPFAAMEIQVGNRGGSPGEELGQRSYMMDAGTGQMELLRIKADYLPYSDHLYRIYREQVVEALFSELNNIYVAFTRACEEMYIFVPEKAGNSMNLLRLLIPEQITEIGRAPDVMGNLQRSGAPSGEGPGGSEDEARLQILPVSQYRDWISYLNEEFASEGSVLIHRDRIRKGKILHDMLATIGTIDPAEAGSLVFQEEAEASGAADIIRTMLLQKHLEPFFYCREGEIFTEKEVVDQNGLTKRIDRLMVKDDEVIVVDYKTARIREEDDGKAEIHSYHAQVRDYMMAVSDLYPGRRVRGYLLYLDCFEIEEVQLTGC